MASAPPSPAWLTRDRVVSVSKLAIGGLLTAIAGGFFAAVFTYYATVRVNTSNALQQQNLAAVQEFVSSGAKVDASITEIADVIADKDDGEKLVDARKEARQAIAAHAAATQSIVQIVGTGNAAAYLDGLGTLRTLVDTTKDSQEALRTSQARFDVLSNRTVIVSEARKRIYSAG